MRLLLRGLWWRRGLTLAVLAVATVTTTAAALGPLYARASAESILQDHLAEAGSTAGLHFHVEFNTGRAKAYTEAMRGVPRPGTIRGFDRMIAGIITPAGIAAYYPADPLGKVMTKLAWRAGACRHLILVQGHCPTGPNQVMASQRTVAAGYYHWRLGTRLELGGVTTPDDDYDTVPNTPPVHIVGVYRPRSVTDPFWFGEGATAYFDAHGNPDGADQVDTIFAARSEFAPPTLGRFTYAEADFDFPLTRSAVRLDNTSAEEATARHLIATHRSIAGLALDTKLPSVLQAAAGERHLVDVGTLLVTLQLGVLAWLVLFQVVADALEARGNEIAMAKLRGYRPAATVRFGLAEPLALLALAVPLGLVLALVVTHVFAGSVLVAGVPVLLTWSALVAALVAFAGGVVAAALAGQRILTRSVLDQWRRTDRRPGHGRLALVVDVVLAAAALAAVIALRRVHRAADSHDTGALLAPALLVFAVAIIGVRLLPPACRRLADRTRASRRMGTFLAARQVSRRPVGLRLAALLAVAVGLATFGVAGETIASTNRTARADAELGAPRVLAVQFSPRLDPVAATRKADPQGRWAMAAATWLPDGGDSVLGTVLGVDATRLAAVGTPVAGGLPTRQVARLVGSSGVDPIAITSTAVRVHLTAQHLTGDHAPQLQVDFRTPREPFLQAEGPPIRDGAQTYVIPIACRDQCRLRSLTWDRPTTAVNQLAGSLTLTGIDVRTAGRWRALDIGLHAKQSWYRLTPQGQATDKVSVTPAGVHDDFTNRNGGYAGIAYGADPSPMPAVATAQSLATGPLVPRPRQLIDSFQTVGTFDVRRTVRVLPAVLDDGLVLDVRYLQDELPGFVSEASWQVWVGADAPADYRARLAAAGLQVVGQRTQSARVDQLGRQAPALALLLLLACALAGAVLAVGGTSISVSASSRRRSYELASLRAVGVSRRTLLRASVIEQLLLLGTAVLIGLPTGLAAARLTMPIIPEFADTTPITLTETPRLGPTLLFAGAFVILLVLTALAAARALMRIAVPARLREAE